jgi:hypothetical protein
MTVFTYVTWSVPEVISSCSQVVVEGFHAIRCKPAPHKQILSRMRAPICSPQTESTLCQWLVMGNPIKRKPGSS